jgi:hypothetical protein
MRKLFNRFNCVDSLADFIKKSMFNKNDIELWLNQAIKLNRKYLCEITLINGSAIIFSFSYKNRLLRKVKNFCGDDFDNQIKTIQFFDTVISDEDLEDEDLEDEE